MARYSKSKRTAKDGSKRCRKSFKSGAQIRKRKREKLLEEAAKRESDKMAKQNHSKNATTIAENKELFKSKRRISNLDRVNRRLNGFTERQDKKNRSSVVNKRRCVACEEICHPKHDKSIVFDCGSFMCFACYIGSMSSQYERRLGIRCPGWCRKLVSVREIKPFLLSREYQHLDLPSHDLEDEEGGLDMIPAEIEIRKAENEKREGMRARKEAKARKEKEKEAELEARIQSRRKARLERRAENRLKYGRGSVAEGSERNASEASLIIIDDDDEV